MEVYKFGGASVKDANAIRNLHRIIISAGTEQLLVVISAIGKTTNALEQVVYAHYHDTGEAFVQLQRIKEVHKDIARDLELEDLLRSGLLDDLFVEAEWLLEDTVHDSYDYLYDQIVAIGELLSTRIVAAFLEKNELPVVWIDVRDVIKTDDSYRNASVDWTVTAANINAIIRPLITSGKIVLTQGFIGSTTELNTSTLGREGSDYTGAILASEVNATSLTVWKDVPGIMTADPHVDKSARLLLKLDYLEALEMTYYGAKVIHPKTIKPLMDKSIPLLVRSFHNPVQHGTSVSSFPDEQYPPLKVVLEDQILLRLSTLDFTFVVENHFSEVFQLVVKHKIKIHLLKNLALSLSLVISPAPEHLRAFIDDLKTIFDVSEERGLKLYTIRHFKPEDINHIKKSGILLIEEYSSETAQLLVQCTS
ncbi:MAG: aspartate kinase [Saprospiraceae bacterium]|nr:aspartate kinase [Saprospiraceae bacterium]